MSIASDCSDSSNATLINMTDLNMTAIEHVAALTNDNSNSKNNDLINVQRRAAEISNQLALVTSADGQVIAVPISQLVGKGNVNLKTSGTVLTVPVGSSASNIKSKTPIITPLKVLPLIASTTASSSVTVPTISHSKNVQTVLAPASMSFATAKAITSATAGGVTIIPTSVSSFSSLTSTETAPQFTATSTATITALPLETKPSIVSNGN
ncbi:unnamed protein product [Sphagnum jensenii]|uniref:Uncharacterized protein n=1 Tax=Sphagnum jensenii TaxID=128206 RepID=A0ABP0V9J4_9BRYO